MNDRRNGDRLYTAVLLAFFAGLLALGLLGVPALLVAALGLVAAAVAIAAFRRPLGRRRADVPKVAGKHQRIPRNYAPSVLEGASVKRRRFAGLRRHRHASPPLRFR